MALKLEKFASGDFTRAFEILSLAFGRRHPYVNVVFPDHDLEHGKLEGGERLKAVDKADKYSHFWKVTDQTSGKMVGFSKWNIYDEGIIPEEVELDGPYWDDGKGDKGHARAIFRAYLVPRRRAIRESGGHLVSLDLMVVDPSEQRRGVGKLLMSPGIEQADHLKVKAVVEASDEGRGLYEKFGFKSYEFVKVALPEPYEGLPMQVFHWMERPAA